jgi:hypothetical protein
MGDQMIPLFNARQDYDPDDQRIVPMESGKIPWPPNVLIAVCAQPIREAR